MGPKFPASTEPLQSTQSRPDPKGIEPMLEPCCVVVIALVIIPAAAVVDVVVVGVVLGKTSEKVK